MIRFHAKQTSYQRNLFKDKQAQIGWLKSGGRAATLKDAAFQSDVCNWDISIMMSSDNIIMHCISLHTNRQTRSAAAVSQRQRQQRRRSRGTAEGERGGGGLSLGVRARKPEAKQMECKGSKLERRRRGRSTGTSAERQWSITLYQRHIKSAGMKRGHRGERVAKDCAEH